MPDWTQSQRTSMPEFLARYTLHDSTLRALEFDVAMSGSAILTIDWDRVWLESPFAEAGQSVPVQPQLFLRLPTIAHVVIAYDESNHTYENGTIGIAVSHPLTPEQREDLLFCAATLREMGHAGGARGQDALPDDIYHTVLETIFGGKVHLYHGRELDVICQEADVRVVRIPGL